MLRRDFTLAAGAAAFFGSAWGQAPRGPVQLVVPFTPAGVTDTLGRVTGEALARKWGQQVVVENRAGASGYIGAELVAKAPANGQTLLVGTSALLTINPHLIKSAFEPGRDLVPITTIGTSDVVVVVNPSVPVRSLQELATYGKSQPEGVSFGSPSTASTHHLTGELLQRRLGIKLVHVPYKGSAPGLNDVMAGHLPMMIDNIISALPFIRSGRLRAIAVSGAARSGSLPDVPTFQESGFPGLQTATWFPLLGPRGMTAETVAAIQRDVAEVLAEPVVREKLLAQGVEPSGETPAALRARIDRDSAQWKRVITDARITL
jgi:tripartite-type tricarboxylate transporter receptor subunit TctC